MSEGLTIVFKGGHNLSIIDKMMFGICFPFMFCCIGGFFARRGYIHFKTKIDKKRRCLMQTMGTIVNISCMTNTANHRRRISYFPTYEYVVGDEVISVEMNMGTNYCQYEIGEQVLILYDTNSPRYSYINGYKEDSLAAIVCLTLGCIAILCGFFVGFVVWFS